MGKTCLKSPYSLLLIMLIGILTSCYSDIEDNFLLMETSGEESIIRSASEWYRSHSGQTKSLDYLEPMWEDAFVENGCDNIYIEVPLSFYQERVFFNSGIDIRDNKVYRNISKIVIEYDKEDELFRGFLMYIVPTDDYYKRHDIADLDSNFSGEIKCFYLSGEPLCSYTIDNGNVVQFKSGASQTTKSTTRLECEDILTITYTEWTYNNSNIIEISNVNYSIETVCWEVGNDGLREHVTELPPKFPGSGSLDLIPEYVSQISTNIKYRDMTDMNEIESILQVIISDSTLSKLMYFLSDVQIEFIHVDYLKNSAKMTFKYNKDNGAYIIKFLKGEVSVDRIFHELSHAWFKENYPNSIISEEQNPEILAVLAEYLSQSHINGVDSVVLEGFNIGDWKSTIPDILKNPSDKDAIDRLIQAFKIGRGSIPAYSRLVLNQSTIYEQIKRFVNFFN